MIPILQAITFASITMAAFNVMGMSSGWSPPSIRAYFFVWAMLIVGCYALVSDYAGRAMQEWQ